MGEGASSALWESLAPTPSQSPLGCAPGVSVPTVLVVLGRSAQRGEEKRFLLGAKARAVFCGRPYDFLPCSSLPFAVSLSPSRLSALEGLIRRQLSFLSLGCCVFSFLARGFAAVSVERPRGC